MRLPDLDALSPRDRRALLIGLALLGPALAWVVGVRPYRAALGEARDEVAAERALLERERTLLASGPELRAALDQARSRALRAERRLVMGENKALAEADLTDELEILAIESRVLLQEIRTVEVAPEDDVFPGMEPLRLAVRGESDLQGVLTFLQRVETSPLLIRIEGLTLDPVTESSGRGDDEAAAPPRPTGVVEFGLVLEAFTRSAKSPDVSEEL